MVGDLDIEGKGNVIDIEGKRKVEIEGDKNIVRVDRDIKELSIYGDKNIVKERDSSFKEDGQKIFGFFKGGKGKLIRVGVLLLLIIILGSWIRVQNLPLLKDSTTGEYIPVALDPFYFLRVAETIVDNGGVLPAVDSMRVLAGGVAFAPEILPQSIVLMWKIANVFGDYSLRYIDVISPVVFFIVGLILFFFLTLSLTDSKAIALISSFFLAIIPTYLYRTMAGFSDHEAIGMLALFSALLVYSYSLKFLESAKEQKSRILKSILWGVVTGLATAFTIASWGGVSKFLFMIIPFSFLIFWLVNINNRGLNFKKNLIVFYSSWFISSFISGLIFGFDILIKFRASVLVPSGILTGFVFLFLVIDYIMIIYREKAETIFKQIRKYRIFYSAIVSVLLAILFMIILGQDIISLFGNLIERILHPFGIDRLGLTVAENKQPYLDDWIGEIGKMFFWISLIGMGFIGKKISEGIRNKKHHITFMSLWIIMILGILFSRISADSILDGSNFLSKFVYFISVAVFGIYILWFYFNKELKVNTQKILIASWMIFMLIAGRGALRLFFVITPFMCFMAGVAPVYLYKYMKKSKDLTKMFLIISVVLISVALVVSSFGFYNDSKDQAEDTGPSANAQWQNAMQWVRENTSEDAVFAHWWDYGYWIEYLGERATIADGGHFEGTYRDHLIGRYILTEPVAEKSLSFMKSNNITHLLIDQTDIGKYAAYSSIGSSEEWDRMDSITTLNVDQSQIQETSTGEIRIYGGAAGVSDDMVYIENGTTIFIPGASFDETGSPSYKSYLLGVIIEIDKSASDGSFQIKQPRGVFYYNGNQYRIPLKYVYYMGQEIEFSEGINAGMQIIPSTYQDSNGFQIDYLGASLYFDSRTIDSLLVQLFLLNDPRGTYPSIKMAYKEENQIVSSLKKQGIALEDFIAYQGIRGPIKIYEVSYPENIIENEDFTKRSGKWAEFDDWEGL